MRATHRHWNTDTMKRSMSTVDTQTTELDKGALFECRRCHFKFFFFSSMQIPEEGKGLGKGSEIFQDTLQKRGGRGGGGMGCTV